jgi:hypothetical protein
MNPMELTMKTRMLFAAAALLCAVPATAKEQACSGVMTFDEAGQYMLSPKPGSGLWCDAVISDGKYIGGPNLVPQVLKVCPVGSRCFIKGTYEGHGVFYWNKILEVKRK